MGQIHHSVATLRFFSDDLVPEEISELLGSQPTESWKKGDERIGKSTGAIRLAKTGMWRFSATRREPEDLEAQIFEILEQLNQDLDVWNKLSARYKPDLYCGIFMGNSNDGLPLSSKALFWLGIRGIDLNLDIYDASDD